MWNIEKHSKKENEAYFTGRASEWAHFPLFITQIAVPPLMLIVPWWVVIVLVIALDLLWSLYREKIVNVKLADFFYNVNKFKWISFIAFGAFYISRSMWIEAVLSFLWPFIAFVLALVIGRPNYEVLKEKFEKSFVDKSN